MDRAVVVGMHSKDGRRSNSSSIHSIFIFISFFLDVITSRRPTTYPTVTKPTHGIGYSLGIFYSGKWGEKEGVFFF